MIEIHKSVENARISFEEFFNENKNASIGFVCPDDILMGKISEYRGDGFSIAQVISGMQGELKKYSDNAPRIEKIKNEIKLVQNLAIHFMENNQVIKDLRDFRFRCNAEFEAQIKRLDSFNVRNLIRFASKHVEKDCFYYILTKFSNGVNQIFEDQNAPKVEICELDKQLCDRQKLIIKLKELPNSHEISRADKRLIRFHDFLIKNPKLISALKYAKKLDDYWFTQEFAKLSEEKRKIIQFSMNKCEIENSKLYLLPRENNK